MVLQIFILKFSCITISRESVSFLELDKRLKLIERDQSKTKSDRALSDHWDDHKCVGQNLVTTNLTVVYGLRGDLFAHIFKNIFKLE